MGWQARQQSRKDTARRRLENDAQAGQRANYAERQYVAGKRVLVQTEYPVPREHAGKKTARRIARLWVKP